MLRKDKLLGINKIKLIVGIGIFSLLALLMLIPTFISLSSTAQRAATVAISGALSATNSNNFAVRSLNASLGSAVTNCTDIGALLHTMPTGYTITSASVTAGNTVTCTVTGPGLTSASFSATGIT